MRSLETIADELGLGGVFYKDEQSRFELSSFKALGGAYAVQLVLRDAMARLICREIAMKAIEDGHHLEVASAITVVTATDGNHGRSVIWGAERFGCKCVIYMHEDVSRGRVEAVEAFGATVRRGEGNYDDSVRAAAAVADEQGWLVVSDTSWPGYLEIPRHVMAGYTVMSGEAMEQWPLDAPPTHVFLQAGCGLMAAAADSDVARRLGLSAESRVLLFGTEGATDPEVYRRLVD